MLPWFTVQIVKTITGEKFQFPKEYMSNPTEKEKIENKYSLFSKSKHERKHQRYTRPTVGNNKLKHSTK